MSDVDVMSSEAAGRYADALYELAGSASALKILQKDLNKLQDIFAKHSDVRQLASNPVYPLDQKADALTMIAKKAKLSKLVVQFVGTCAKNRRAHELPAIIRAFNAKLAQEQGTSVARVTSATRLSTAQMNAIKAQLKKALGKTVAVQHTVDPELLGGFKIQIGSRLFDSSLKTKLDGLKLAMKEV